ncbi:hypothetical protein EDB80DRAFT_685389 [Ilyonectria destructans]|nr:hypothetical protein EDB80DRAFT_685389 [Ilyonectria destructans]
MMAVKNGQPLDVMAHPSRDLFCFTLRRPSSEIQSSSLFHYPPFSSLNGGSTSIQNIAMEFDPSWNIDPPEDIHELLDEFTTHGCVARAVNARAKEYVEFTIWLIDRGATRSPDKDREFPPHVFYDCEREYVETERNEILHDTEEGYRKTAWWFIERLTRLGTPYYAEMRDPLATEKHGHGGSIESEISAQLPPSVRKINNRTSCPSKLLYGVSSGLGNIRMSWNV